jgi:SAM-dependent methyltransferase
VGTGFLGNLLKRPSRYRARHFRRREAMRTDYLFLADSLLSRLSFKTVADVGCANGFLLEAFVEAGKEAAGVELSPEVVEVLAPEVKPIVSIGDFSTLEGQWDLTCCIEVAEHIPPRRSLELVETLTRAATDWIFFTAAPPGQGGRGHINCRPHADWLAEFEQHGWVADSDRTEAVRHDLEELKHATWLRGNGFVLAPQN